MEEVDVFGVRIPGTDRVYFLSVMGMLGEWTAISAYRGLEGLAGFYKLQDQGDVLPPETILTVPHFMLSFREREGLSPEQLESIKSSGISFRGDGNWLPWRWSTVRNTKRKFPRQKWRLCSGCPRVVPSYNWSWPS